jgi:hypothetical protein
VTAADHNEMVRTGLLEESVDMKKVVHFHPPVYVHNTIKSAIQYVLKQASDKRVYMNPTEIHHVLQFHMFSKQSPTLVDIVDRLNRTTVFKVAQTRYEKEKDAWTNYYTCHTLDF